MGIALALDPLAFRSLGRVLAPIAEEHFTPSVGLVRRGRANRGKWQAAPAGTDVIREAYMRKLFATIAILAMSTHLARAADEALSPSSDVKARAPNGVVLAGAMGTMGGTPPPMITGGPPGTGSGSFMGGMPPTGGGTFMGGMHPTGTEGANTGDGTDPPRAKIRNNPRSRKTFGVQ